MRRELLLAGALGVLALTLGVGAVAVPGALAEPPDDLRESYLTLQQPYVEATDISRETVTLSLSTRLEHRGGTADNVTVITRAVDSETGLVATTDRQALGNIDGDRDVPFTTTITVERQGGYRVEILVFADERRVASHQGTVSNIDALTPPSSQSSVTFHEFDNQNTPLQAISYRLVSVTNNQSTLNVTTYLTNTGDEQAGGLVLRMRARQADSNVIADESTLQVGQIRPGRTQTVSTELTVPDGYDYWLDGILTADGIIVATESAVADLDPTETLSVNETRQDTGFESEDFTRQTDSDLDGREFETGRATASASGPGFTVVATLLAALAASIALARRDP